MSSIMTFERPNRFSLSVLAIFMALALRFTESYLRLCKYIIREEKEFQERQLYCTSTLEILDRFRCVLGQQQQAAPRGAVSTVYGSFVYLLAAGYGQSKSIKSFV